MQKTFNIILGLLFLFATIVFLWGVIKFIASSQDEKAKRAGKALMTWSIVGLALMASAWGLANILIEYLEIPNEPPVPLR